MTDSETMTQQLRVDELLEAIRQEASYLEQQEGVSMTAASAHKPLRELANWQDAPEPLPMKLEYHVNEFLVYDDIEFVGNAFRGILQREPDETGLDGYTRVLRRQGDPVKWHILIDLLDSEEGRANKVRILGMRWARWEHKYADSWWFQRPFIRKLYDIAKYRLRNDQLSYSLVTDKRNRANMRRVSKYLGEQSALFDLLRDREQQRQLDQQLLEHQAERYRRELQLTRSDLLIQQQRVNRLLERLQAFAGELPESAAAELSALAGDKLEAFYFAFENDCRGDEADIREQLAVYLPRVQAAGPSAQAPLLDVGCGRGEWLALLRDEGLPALGVDLNSVLVEHCREAGLEVTLEDALAYLRRQDSASLGAVTAFHIIEHLPFEQLFSLVEECHRVLVPGGLLIFETPNPENMNVGSHTFYHDPTHRNPITPTLIDFLLQHQGFVDVEIERLHPYPEAARVPGNDAVTDRVNGAFCGPQDYAVIGTRPA